MKSFALVACTTLVASLLATHGVDGQAYQGTVELVDDWSIPNIRQGKTFRDKMDTVVGQCYSVPCFDNRATKALWNFPNFPATGGMRVYFFDAPNCDATDPTSWFGTPPDSASGEITTRQLMAKRFTQRISSFMIGDKPPGDYRSTPQSTC